MKHTPFLTLFVLTVVTCLIGCTVTVSPPLSITTPNLPPPPSEETEAFLPDEAEEAPASETPPPLQLSIEPDVVVVPSGENYVYMIPDTYGVYFYGDSWYRYYNGYWFRAKAYNAAWISVAASIVPPVVVHVSPEYVYSLPRNYHRIHYAEFHHHWREWDHSHYWHQHEWYKHEMRPEVARERHALIEKERERWRKGEMHRPIGFPRRDTRKPEIGKLETPRKPDISKASEIRKPEVRKSEVEQKTPEVRKPLEAPRKPAPKATSAPSKPTPSEPSPHKKKPSQDDKK